MSSETLTLPRCFTTEITYFQFTRHLLSCNNIGCGYPFGKDWEPSATAYGITKTVQFANENKARFNSNTVYVSNLIRTWMTAVLLYGTQAYGTYGTQPYSTKQSETTLNLYVSPYLKEYHLPGIHPGNYPYDTYSKSLEQFRTFLNTLQRYVVRCSDKICIHFIDVNAPTLSSDTNPICKFKKQHNQYIYESSPLHPRLTDRSFLRSNAFLKTGNLEQFMQWYNNINKHVHTPVHVVTHSNIMKEYLKTLNLDIKKQERI